MKKRQYRPYTVYPLSYDQMFKRIINQSRHLGKASYKFQSGITFTCEKIDDQRFRLSQDFNDKTDVGAYGYYSYAEYLLRAGIANVYSDDTVTDSF